MSHLTTLFAALYVSEGWYERYRMTGSLHARARASVLYDRVLTGQIQLNGGEA